MTSAGEYRHLVQWLLRDVWFVETLTDALQFRRSIKSPIRLVTRNGESVDQDGRLVVGEAKSAAGLLSRRTELRDLHFDFSELEANIAQRDTEILELVQATEQEEAEVKQLVARRSELRESAAACRLKSEAANERVAELRQQLDVTRGEEEQTLDNNAELVGQLTAQKEQLVHLESLVRSLEAAVSSHRADLQTLETASGEYQKATTEWEVAVAKSEQRLEALTSQCDQLIRDQDERQQALTHAQEQTSRFLHRKAAAELRILNATAEVARQYVDNERFQLARTAVADNALELRRQRTTANATLDGIRNRLRSIEQQQHASELSAEKIRHERSVLADRLEEDYGITTTLLEQSPSTEELAEREQVDAEIR